MDHGRELVKVVYSDGNVIVKVIFIRGVGKMNFVNV